MSSQSNQEYQFLLSIIGDDDENTPYRIIDVPSMGIDLFFLNDTIIPPVHSINGRHTIVDMHVKARLLNITKYNSYQHININEFIRLNLSTCPFILTANVYILNTPLRITDIGGYDAYTIDTIKLALTNLSSRPYTIRKNTTIAQLSHPALHLIKMKLVHPDDHIFHQRSTEDINNELFIINTTIINNENIDEIINNENIDDNIISVIEGIDNLNI
jgi:hypothetical protein